jgi:hypothetical protein
VLQVKAITAHVAQKPERTQLGKRCPQRIAEVFGWPKTVGGLRNAASRPPHGRLADSSPNLHVTNH